MAISNAHRIHKPKPIEQPSQPKQPNVIHPEIKKKDKKKQ